MLWLVPNCVCWLRGQNMHPGCPLAKKRTNSAELRFQPFLEQGLPLSFSLYSVTDFHETCLTIVSLRYLFVSQWVKIFTEGRQADYSNHPWGLSSQEVIVKKIVLLNFNSIFFYMNYSWFLDFQRPCICLVFLTEPL